MKAASCFFRWTAALAVAAVAAVGPLGPASAQSAAPKPECSAPGDLARLDHPLTRMAHRVAGGQPVTIVAVGSSSTAGAGASSPAMSYPSRLAVELKALFPRTDITVINRGVNGETANEMLARFDRDVFADKPDLVLWQVGSNSVLRDMPLSDAKLRLSEGLRRLRASGADVILMNPQYAPKVISKREAEGMVDLIDAAARETHVDLFQRYAVMRYWRLTEGLPFGAFVSPDELHMNDWSYGCIAKLLATAIHEAASRATVTATARQPR
jgi:lysophospholipase L1-like esterase